MLSSSLPSSLPSLHTRRLPYRPEMSSSSLHALPENNRIVLGCGAVTVDYLATVEAFPRPDDKIRSTSLKVEGGGNAGNALTSAARLGLKSRLVSKVATDAQGRTILAELEGDGVDTSYIVVSEQGNSPFTYIIVDNQTKTRTCIHTPGYPAMLPDELSNSSLYSALDGANLVYLDGRIHETALAVAEEANRRKIPILVDAEKKREGLDDLLNFATYVVCSEKFPQAWTEAPSIPSALVSMLLRLPNIKFVIVTLGDKGCIMLERSIIETSEVEETEVESLLDSLKHKIHEKSITPTCISSQSEPATSKVNPVQYGLRLNVRDLLNFQPEPPKIPQIIPGNWKYSFLSKIFAILHEFPLVYVISPSPECEPLYLLNFQPELPKILRKSREIGNISPYQREQSLLNLTSVLVSTFARGETSLRLSAEGIGAVTGRLLVGSAEVIPPPELVDTTGAGDAFIGAILYAICAQMPPERMLPFAAQVAAAGCRALGARTGLPWRTDPRLAPFWL